MELLGCVKLHLRHYSKCLIGLQGLQWLVLAHSQIVIMGPAQFFGHTHLFLALSYLVDLLLIDWLAQELVIRKKIHLQFTLQRILMFFTKSSFVYVLALLEN